MQGIVSGLRKQSVVFLLFSLVFTFTGMSLMGCGGSSSKPLGVTVTASSSTVDGADKITVTATVANDKAAAGVTWAMTGAGALSNTSTSGATYTAPAPTASSQSATITATSVADATKTASVTITIPAAPAITTAALPRLGGLGLLPVSGGHRGHSPLYMEADQRNTAQLPLDCHFRLQHHAHGHAHPCLRRDLQQFDLYGDGLRHADSTDGHHC